MFCAWVQLQADMFARGHRSFDETIDPHEVQGSLLARKAYGL
jgi:hypothetical protein